MYSRAVFPPHFEKNDGCIDGIVEAAEPAVTKGNRCFARSTTRCLWAIARTSHIFDKNFIWFSANS